WEAYTPSGSAYTFTNGITESGGTVQLGGAFTSSVTTTIDASTTYTIGENANDRPYFRISRGTSQNIYLYAIDTVGDQYAKVHLGSDNGDGGGFFDVIVSNSTSGILRRFSLGSNSVTLNLGSDATGDTYHRDS